MLAYIDTYLYNSAMSDANVSGQAKMEVGQDFVGNNKEETTYNYERTRETIGALTDFADRMKESDPLISQAVQSFFDNEARLVQENRNLWRMNDDLRSAVLVQNETHNSSLNREKELIERVGRLEERALVSEKNHQSALERERNAYDKIVKLENGCPSFRFKVFVWSLGIYALFSAPVILLDIYKIIYTLTG